MIGFLRGTVAGRTPDGCFVDVAGVGYVLACPLTTVAVLPPDGSEVRLWTHLHVREDALSLYGFATEDERELFGALLSISGVGPKVALHVCSSFSPESLRRTIVSEDVAAIAEVPGIGRKTAHRIVLDLKDSMTRAPVDPTGGSEPMAQARSALENLGYAPAEVRAALARVTASDRVETIVTEALRVLAGERYGVTP